jgi:hypothetical protein
MTIAFFNLKEYPMRLASILSIFMVYILLVTSCSAWPRQYNDDGVSNEEYIRVASEIEETQTFLELFPEAEILVDRSSKLAVDYRFTLAQPTTTVQFWEGIRLRVFINPESKRAEGAFIQCSDHGGQSNLVEEELIEYMKQFEQDLSCP